MHRGVVRVSSSRGSTSRNRPVYIQGQGSRRACTPRASYGSSFGSCFRVTTFGESHGAAVGCVVDGVPARLKLTRSDIQRELDRRRPGQSRITTPRNEQDACEIVSGLEGDAEEGYVCVWKVWRELTKDELTNSRTHSLSLSQTQTDTLTHTQREKEHSMTSTVLYEAAHCIRNA